MPSGKKSALSGSDGCGNDSNGCMTVTHGFGGNADSFFCSLLKRKGFRADTAEPEVFGTPDDFSAFEGCCGIRQLEYKNAALS